MFQMVCLSVVAAVALRHQQATKSSPNDPPPKQDRDNCAICHFAARVMPTTVVSFVLPELGLLERLPQLAPAIPTHIWEIETYQSRGPPINV